MAGPWPMVMASARIATSATIRDAANVGARFLMGSVTAMNLVESLRGVGRRGVGEGQGDLAAAGGDLGVWQITPSRAERVAIHHVVSLPWHCRPCDGGPAPAGWLSVQNDKVLAWIEPIINTIAII